jgi:hypothetical protein
LAVKIENDEKSYSKQQNEVLLHDSVYIHRISEEIQVKTVSEIVLGFQTVFHRKCEEKSV